VLVRTASAAEIAAAGALIREARLLAFLRRQGAADQEAAQLLTLLRDADAQGRAG
jgi:hypothetical protein